MEDNNANMNGSLEGIASSQLLNEKQARPINNQFIKVWSEGQLFCKFQGVFKWNPTCLTYIFYLSTW